MAQVIIPDELAQRVGSYLKSRGEDLATFTARAFNELLSIDEDQALQAELIEKTRHGFNDLDNGRVAELRQLSAELGITPRQ